MIAARTLTLLMLVASGASARPVSSGPMYFSGTTGTVFMQICKSQLWQPGDYDPCGSYLLGLIDAYANAGVLCPRAGVGNRQMEQIAFNYVRDHPEHWQYPMSLTIRAALVDYACKGKNAQ